MAQSAQYLINGENISLSPQDRGLSYGDGIFRTLRIKRGVPIAWSLHYAKLEQDSAALGMICPSQDILLGDIARLCTEHAEAVVKVIVTRGMGSRGYAIPSPPSHTRIVIAEPFQDYPDVYHAEGVNLHLCNLRLSHQPRLAGIKHLNRLENVLARSEWSGSEYADGLLLDQDGWVIECTMSNIFARFDATLVTPVLDQCGVAGVTRQRILDNAATMGYTAEIRPMTLAQLMQADEVIICNSLIGAWQVRALNNREWTRQDSAARIRDILEK